MELKKYDHANLEKQKGIFLKLGYIIVLAVLLIAFEWASRPNNDGDSFASNNTAAEEDIIPITMQKPPEPPPPAAEPPKVTIELEIVKDEVKVDNDLDIDAEADDKTKIDMTPIVQEEEKIVEEEVFMIVEDMPKFNGQDKDAFRSYIMQNLKYPEIATENGIQGTVYVQFVVNSRGDIADVKVVRGVDPSLDEAAVKVIKGTPSGMWTPGKQRGKPVKVQFIFPVKFVLN